MRLSISDDQVREIRRRYAAGERPLVICAAMFPDRAWTVYFRAHITRIAQGVCRTTVTDDSTRGHAQS